MCHERTLTSLVRCVEALLGVLVVAFLFVFFILEKTKSTNRPTRTSICVNLCEVAFHPKIKTIVRLYYQVPILSKFYLFIWAFYFFLIHILKDDSLIQYFFLK